MPYYTSKAYEEFLEIKVPGSLYDRLTSNWLEDSVFVEDVSGQKYVRPGLILAQDTTTYKYVPYNSGASYGDGSDTAVGVLDTFEILSMGEEAIAPIYHGKLIEAHCYVFGGDLGDISSTVKTHLKDIKWV